VDHQRRAVIVEQRIRLALLERHVDSQHLDLEIAVLRDVQVRQIAGMAITGQHAVLVIARVEVRTGRLKRGLAFADRVDVHGVLAGLLILDGYLDQNAALGLREIGGADRLAALVLEVGVGDLRRLRTGGERKAGDQRGGAGKFPSVETFHVMPS
jgi:hypothetical protein